MPGSWDFPVSYVPESQSFLFLWTFTPTLQPLKQHSFKKLFAFSIYYTNTDQTYLKIFPSWRFLGQLPGAWELSDVYSKILDFTVQKAAFSDTSFGQEDGQQKITNYLLFVTKRYLITALASRCRTRMEDPKRRRIHIALRIQNLPGPNKTVKTVTYAQAPVI